MRHKKLLRVAIIGMAMASLFTACPEPKDIKNLKTPPKEEAVEEEREAPEAGADGDDAGADTPPPTITGAPVIKSNPLKSSGTYKIGETILVAVTFSEKVKVDTKGNNENIYVGLRIGTIVQAIYESGSSTDTLIFAYIVKSGDKSDPRGINIRKDSLTIRTDSGASIKDAVGNDADLKHKSMNLQESHKVDAKTESKEGGDKDAGAGGDEDAVEEEENEAPDTTAPTITEAPTIKSNPKSSKTYKIGEVIEIAVTFSEKVNVDTNGDDKNIYVGLQISRKTVQARYKKGSSSNTLTFAYTVKSGDNSDPRGINIREGALAIENGASIKDEAGNLANPKHKSMKLQSNHKVDTRPIVTEVKIEKDETYTKVPAFKTFRKIEVAVTFSEKVWMKPIVKEAKKNIYVKLLIGAKPKRARYQRGTGSETLTFAYKYTVKSGDTAPKGIRIPKNALTITPDSGASIKDAAGNNAKLEHSSSER